MDVSRDIECVMQVYVQIDRTQRSSVGVLVRDADGCMHHASASESSGFHLSLFYHERGAAPHEM